MLETLCPMVSSFSCFKNVDKPQNSSLSLRKTKVMPSQPILYDVMHDKPCSWIEDKGLDDELTLIDSHPPIRLVFDNITFFLDENGLHLERKEFKQLTEIVIENGGKCSKYINNSVNFFITGQGTLNSRLSVFSLKQKAALQLNIPIVTTNFIYSCIKENELLKSEAFLLINSSKSESFQLGEITLMKQNKKKKLYNTVKNVSINEYIAEELENFILLKYVQLKGKTTCGNAYGPSVNYQFFILEIHGCVMDNYDVPNQYCIFTHEGEIKNLVSGKKLCRYVSTAEEAQNIYGALLKQMTGAPKYLMYTQEYLSESLGSASFQRIQHEFHVNFVLLEPSVIYATDILWKETKHTLAEVLAGEPLQIPSWKIKEAKKTIMQIALFLKNGKENSLNRLSEEFYNIIHFKKEKRETLLTFPLLNEKYKLLEKLQDLIKLKELYPLDIEHNPEARCRALSCNISKVSEDMDDYEDICNLVLNSQTENTCIKIRNIFKISRNAESVLYRGSLGNKKQLFHGTSPDNLLGIISRGLQVQNSIGNEISTEWQFHNLLGPGIYFTDSSSYCTRFCKPNAFSGTRMIMVCEVALGKVYETLHGDPKMTSPPLGYDSVLGGKNEGGSDFYENEYVIFDQCQSKLQYLVEYSLPEDKIFSQDISMSTYTENTKATTNANENITNYSFDITPINNDQEPGVGISNGLECVNPFHNIHLSLKSIHIKAKIVDLVGKVYMFQEYKNDSEKHLEVRYIFPLDKGAAICGFEAFIGAKHIIGEVKEKETAREEYETAKKDGHGAFLLEGTSQNVFSIQIGNLPPKTRAIIKITFIAELNIENDSVEFVLPSLWQKATSLKENYMKPDFSFESSIEMAREILSINSPSHDVVTKKTDTKAVVKLLPKEKDTLSDLKLYIRVNEIHVPRMWIEKHPERDTRACMVTFYPKFNLEDMSRNSSIGNTILFLLDASDSMKGDDFQNLIYIVLLSLELMKPNTLFNIVAYGTIHRELFSQAMPFSLDNHTKAKEFLSNLLPNMGKSQLSQTIRSYHLLLSTNKNDVFLVSNGIRNDELDILKLSLNKMRVFSFGLGNRTNHHLLSLLSHKTGGSHFSYDAMEKDKWKLKINYVLGKSQQPSLTNIEIEWQNENNVMQAPLKVYSIFNGSSQIIYALDTFCTLATLKAKIEEQEVSTVVASYELSQTTGTLLHCLAARAYVKDWEDGILNENEIMHLVSKEERKETITNLAKEYSLVTSLTSFVAVEKRSNPNESFSEIDIESFLNQVDVDILNYLEFSMHKHEIFDLSTESDSTYETRSSYEAGDNTSESRSISEDDDHTSVSTCIFEADDYTSVSRSISEVDDNNLEEINDTYLEQKSFNCAESLEYECENETLNDFVEQYEIQGSSSILHSAPQVAMGLTNHQEKQYRDRSDSTLRDDEYENNFPKLGMSNSKTEKINSSKKIFRRLQKKKHLSFLKPIQRKFLSEAEPQDELQFEESCSEILSPPPPPALSVPLSLRALSAPVPQFHGKLLKKKIFLAKPNAVDNNTVHSVSKPKNDNGEVLSSKSSLYKSTLPSSTGSMIGTTQPIDNTTIQSAQALKIVRSTSPSSMSLTSECPQTFNSVNKQILPHSIESRGSAQAPGGCLMRSLPRSTDFPFGSVAAPASDKPIGNNIKPASINSSGFSFGAAAAPVSGQRIDNIIKPESINSFGFSFGAASAPMSGQRIDNINPVLTNSTGLTFASSVAPASTQSIVSMKKSVLPNSAGLTFGSSLPDNFTSRSNLPNVENPLRSTPTYISTYQADGFGSSVPFALADCKALGRSENLNYLDKPPSTRGFFGSVDLNARDGAHVGSFGAKAQGDFQEQQLCRADETSEGNMYPITKESSSVDLSVEEEEFTKLKLKKRKKKMAFEEIKTQKVANELSFSSVKEIASCNTIPSSSVIEILSSSKSKITLALSLLEESLASNDFKKTVLFMENHLKLRGGSFPIISSLLDYFWKDLRKQGKTLDDFYSFSVGMNPSKKFKTSNEQHPLLQGFKDSIISMENELTDNGLISLGANIVETVLNMLVDVSVLQINLLYLLLKFTSENAEILMELDSSFFQVIKSLSYMLHNCDTIMSKAFVISALENIKVFDKKYPMLYSVLTKDKSWEDFIFSHFKKNF